MPAKGQKRTHAVQQTERPPRGGLSEIDQSFDQAATAAAFRFLRQPLSEGEHPEKV
jgi:hypothetical protein